MLKLTVPLLTSSISSLIFAAMTLAAGSGMAKADSFTLSPEDPAELSRAPAPAMSAAEMEDFIKRFHAKREARAARAVAAAASDVDAETSAAVGRVAPTIIGANNAAKFPDTITVGRNLKNTKAEAAGNSTLAEPAAANNRNQVVYAGNFSHAERSTNHGLTYTSFTIPAGPADAPIRCCDNDMAYDEATNTVFHVHLYTNSAQTNGVVRIFVKNPANLSLTKCSYLIDPGGGAASTASTKPKCATASRPQRIHSPSSKATSASGYGCRPAAAMGAPT
jgi:hypothetical protein